MGTKKISIDLTENNKKALENMVRNYGNRMKVSPFINLLIKTFCFMPDEIQKDFISLCKTRIADIDDNMQRAGEFEKKALEQKKEHYLTIAKILNDGFDIPSDSIHKMVKYKIKCGFIIVPGDWIVLNPDDAEYCAFAFVVECRNSATYGIPHFLYFTHSQYGIYKEEETINDLCIEKWPDFKSKVIDKQVPPIQDPETKEYINLEEHLASPQIGLFPISLSDSRNDEDDFPFGAMIVRTEPCEEDNEPSPLDRNFYE